MRRTLLITASVLASLAVAPGAHAAKKPAKPGDFNGDGRRDQAFVHRGAKPGKGLIAVVYGGKPGRQVLTPRSKGVKKVLRNDLMFDAGLTSADFDKDGYADLVGTASAKGGGGYAVFVLYGSKKGLAGRVAELPAARAPLSPYGERRVADVNGNGWPDLMIGGSLYLDVRKGKPKSPVGDFDYSSVALGDYDGDGFADAASISRDNSGVINLAEGSATGLGAYAPLPGKKPFTSSHRATVLSGDLNGDGLAELIVGAPSVGGWARLGQVLVYPGTPAGPGTPRRLRVDDPDVPGESLTDDEFGVSLSVGDVNKDGYNDLAVGDNGSEPEYRGRVFIFYGSAAGITTKGAQLIDRDTKGFPGIPTTGDWLGHRVLLGDFTGDGRADLAVAAPGDLFAKRKGAVYVLKSNGRITTKGLRTLTPGSLRIPATVFGRTMLG